MIISFLVTYTPYISLLLPYLLFLLCLGIIILYESYCIADSIGETSIQHKDKRGGLVRFFYPIRPEVLGHGNNPGVEGGGGGGAQHVLIWKSA